MLADDLQNLERQRQSVQERIDGERSLAERNRLGQFATPHSLAVEIARYVEQLIGRKTIGWRFADPALGTGSFFSAALSAFGPERINSAIGIELDRIFVSLARDLWQPFGLEVVPGDFTRLVAEATPPASPDVILANPPYVRHHHLDRGEKERLQRLSFQMTGVQVNGLAGLYVYFVLLATAWMKDGGFAAWLIPSEFMDVNYGESLKRFLCDRVTLLRVHRFNPDDVQFGDALVSSAVLVFRKSAPPEGHTIEFTYGGTLFESQARDRLSVDELRKARKWTAYPRHERNDRRASTGDGPMLADLFRIQRGIATGSNKFFVLDRAEASRLELPSQYLRPILPSPRQLKTTVIDGDEDGYPILDRQLCLIDCDLPEHVVESRFPPLWNYLQSAQSLGIKDGYLVGKRTPWYKQERRAPAPFLCTYMGRSASDKQPFRFIWNRSKAVGSNLYLLLYPQKGLSSILNRQSNASEDVYQLLNQVTGHELRGEGRVYGGGLNKIEPSELGRISAAPLIERWPELSAAVKRHKPLNLFD